jgi:hypothetical protein
LWFLDQLEPGGATYNIPLAVRLGGRLQAPALRRSLSEILRRHEVLRTCFPARDGDPSQEILSPEPIPLLVVDLGELAEGQRELAARRLAEEEARRPFDLSRGPLLRAGLLRLGEEDHALLVTMHHIVSDGWSLGILVREFTTLYQAYSEGRESPLEEIRLQYADFACWQREWLQGDVLERQLSYWRRQLAGAPTLELATDYSRSATASRRGARVPLAVPTELTDKLEALSRQEGVTLFMTLLAAFQTLLYRYTGQPDIVVGAPIANRNRIETEGLIGFFVNMLALRTNLSGDLSFRQLLRRVREMTLNAYLHQDLPFEKLVEELAPARDMWQSPMFRVCFALQNVVAPDNGTTSELTVTSFGAKSVTAKLDLTLIINQTASGLVGHFIYASDLWFPDSIAQMSEHYQSLLEMAAKDPDCALIDMSLSEHHKWSFPNTVPALQDIGEMDLDFVF